MNQSNPCRWGGRALVAMLAVAGTVFGAAHSAEAQTEVVGNVNFSQTWSPGNSPYILLGDVTIRNQATLTILPGTEIRYAATDALGAGEDAEGVELVVEGEIHVQGTAEQPVVFTGQDDPGPAAHATGVRLSIDARASSFLHASFAGLHTTIDIRNREAVTFQHVDIAGAAWGVKRSTNVVDITFEDCDLTASSYAVDLVAPAAGIDVSFVRSTLQGGEQLILELGESVPGARRIVATLNPDGRPTEVVFELPKEGGVTQARLIFGRQGVARTTGIELR
jgi:hypothetical protein